MVIKLTKDDIDRATRCGESRQSHDAACIRDQRVCNQGSLEINVNGAKAELAVVKMTGYPWNCFSEEFWNVPKQERPADVGPIEVRTNNRKFNVNMLLFQKNDSDMRPYLLAVPETTNSYRLAGWRFGFECRKDVFWQAEWKRPCYAIPEGMLYSLVSLENWCISHGYTKWQKVTNSA